MIDGERLAATIAAHAELVTFTVERISEDEARITVFSGGRAASYLHPVLSDEHVETERSVTSALWAITAVMRQCRSVAAFCAFLSNKNPGGLQLSPDDPEQAARFEAWDKTAHEAVAMFGDTWGDYERGLVAL